MSYLNPEENPSPFFVNDEHNGNVSIISSTGEMITKVFPASGLPYVLHYLNGGTDPKAVSEFENVSLAEG